MPKAPAAQPLSQELAQRSLEHGCVEWLQVSEDDLRELAAGRVPELLQRNAIWALEPVEIMLQRTRKKV